MIISEYDQTFCAEGIKTFYFKLDCSKERKIIKIDLDFEGVTGYNNIESKEILNNKFIKLITKEDREFVISSLKNNPESQCYSIQYNILSKFNLLKKVEERGKVFYKNNKPVYTEGVIIELYTETNIHQEPSSNNETYKTLTKNTKDGIFVLENKTIIYINGAFNDFTGYTQDDLIGKEFMFLFPEEELGKLLIYNKARLNGESVPSNYETKIKSKAGEILDVEFNLALFENADNKQIIGTFKYIGQKNKIIKSLIQSDSRLKHTLEIINDGLWEWDLTNDSFFINEQFLRYTDYSIKSYPTKIDDFINLINHSHRDIFFKTKSLINNNVKDHFVLELKIQAIDNGWIWIYMKGIVAERNSKGQAIKVIGSFTNITDLKNYESLLIENFSTMERIVDTIPVPMFYKTRKGTFTGCNSAFANYLNLEKNEIIGKKVSDFFSDEYLQKSAKIENKLLTKKTAQSIEFEYLHLDGSMRNIFLHKNIYYNAYKEKEEILEIINDITLQKNIKFELDEKSNFLTTIIKNFPMILWVINKNGILTLFEGKGLTKINTFPGEFVGHSIFNIFPHQPSLIESINDALKGNHRLDRFTYEGLTLETHYTPVYSKNKKIDGVIGISFDITDRVRAEEDIKKYINELKASNTHYEAAAAKLVLVNSELEKSEQKLKKLNIDKDRFFSIISHDLRSPFSSLIGLSEIIVDNYNDLGSYKKKDIATALQTNVNNIYNLLENLLDWSKIQIGRSIFEPEKIKLSEITDSVFELLKSNAHKKNITLINHINPEYFAFADKNMVHTVIRNLVSNSIKFTPTNGSITVNCSVNSSKLLIEISDTGLGIKKKDQKKLFKINVIHSTLGCEGEKGTGLGLILCKELVEKNNGEIDVTSKLGKGSTFSFTLPKAK